MNDGSGPVASDSSIDGFNNPGKIVGTPDWRAGWIGSGSLYLDGSTVVDIDAEPNGLDAIGYGITLAGWFKADAPNVSQHIFEKTNAWTLRLLTSGMIRTRFYGLTDTYMDSLAGQRFDDGHWYHVAATYSAVDQEAHLYVNGLLQRTVPTSGQIAGSDPNLILGRDWLGGLDDLYVYSYALTPSAVEGLAGMGDRVPFVDAGPDQTYHINPSLPLVLQGSVIDPDSTPVIEWSVVQGNPASVTFVNDASPTTAVYFNPTDAGIFVLRLSATDIVGGQPVVIHDDVTITTVAPTCADVLAAGLRLPMDVSGPIEGQPDCYVNLYDLAYFANSWLECNDPENAACDWPW